PTLPEEAVLPAAPAGRDPRGWPCRPLWQSGGRAGGVVSIEQGASRVTAAPPLVISVISAGTSTLAFRVVSAPSAIAFRSFSVLRPTAITRAPIAAAI